MASIARGGARGPARASVVRAAAGAMPGAGHQPDRPRGKPGTPASSGTPKLFSAIATRV